MNADVLAAQSGDVPAFERLVRRWQGAVCAIGLGVVQDVAASEDVAQEVFLSAWLGLGQLKNPASFGAWLRQMTRHKALAHRRATARRQRRVVIDPEAVDRASRNHDPLLAAERGRVLQEALDALPEEARDVLILYYREGNSTQQVAELLDLSVSAVKKRLSRARQRVRGDVLERFDEVARATVPGATLTAAVIASLTPGPAAAAATAALTAGGWKTATAAFSAGSAIGGAGLFLGYGLAMRALAPEIQPQLRYARNLSLVGLVCMLATGLISRGALVFGMLGFVVLLAYIQFRMLPRILFPEEEHQNEATKRRTARIGKLIGAAGWSLGAVCGLGGAIWAWLYP